MAQTRVGIRNGALFNNNSTLWNNLLAYYTGDNTPNDALGNYNGTLVNGTTYGTGKINGGFSFDGVNDYVSLPNGMFNPSGDYSISFWMLTPPVPNFQLKTIFGLGAFTNNSIVVYLYGNGSNTELRFLNSNSSTYQLISTNINPFLNTFIHVSTIKDTEANKYYLYVNGTLVSQSNITVNFSPNSLLTKIGSIGTGNNYFQGRIDELGIFTKALTPTEVTELYNGKQYPN